MSVYPPDVDVRRYAAISDCGLYRYSLLRWWGDGPLLTFVMLNPSTADAEQDDPTIRRCVGFARREGLDGIRVVNLYAFRATKPADLWKAAEPTGGHRNDDVLARAAISGGPVVAAWGAHAKPARVARVVFLMGDLHVLGFTKGGAPRHPLYLPGDASLTRWEI